MTQGQIELLKAIQPYRSTQAASQPALAPDQARDELTQAIEYFKSKGGEHKNNE